MSHITCTRVLPLTLLSFVLACTVACKSGRTPAQVTIEPLTPTSAHEEIPVDTAVNTVAATSVPAPPACPDPNVTPVPSTTALPTSSSNITTQPTAPIRIQHPAVVPSPLTTVTRFGTPLPTPLPLRPDADLESLIRDRLGADTQHYAAFIESLRDGRSVAIDADRVFYAASLFKLEVMYEVFHQRHAGVLDFGEEFIASDYYSGFNVGPHVVALCDRVNIGELLSDMMSVSDNVAAVILQDRAGARNVNDAMAELGMTKTGLTEDGSLPATVSDVALLLRAIARGDAVSADASAAMADLMRSEEVNDRIPAELPTGTRIAHKTGNWDNATHDAGIVYGTKGTYVMVLMSDLGFGSDAAQVEADVAEIAFDYFER